MTDFVSSPAFAIEQCKTLVKPDGGDHKKISFIEAMECIKEPFESENLLEVIAKENQRRCV